MTTPTHPAMGDEGAPIIWLHCSKHDVDFIDGDACDECYAEYVKRRLENERRFEVEDEMSDEGAQG